jgi:hypothetical protein
VVEDLSVVVASINLIAGLDDDEAPAHPLVVLVDGPGQS